MHKERVELHVHTKMSAMDGVSSVTDLVNRAAAWGHPAIAVTDHGVVQAFPEAMRAADECRKRGQNIKLLYGMEAYYVNDFVPVVSGDSNEAFEGEFILLDLETTGLNAMRDRMTEIGAVRVKNGKITDHFNTFVQPGIPIPDYITELTGIDESMIKGAPHEADALKMFYNFCGEASVLVAHNFPFDTRFLCAAAERCGIPYTFTSVDTVPLCRMLYPHLKNHKLDTIADYLELTPFPHYRACDNASVLAEIFLCLLQKLKEKYELQTIAALNDLVFTCTMNSTVKTRPTHMTVLAQNRIGLKNLYKLVSWSHLHDFHRKPRIRKSKLLEHREGLLLGSACEMGELYRAVVDDKPWEELCAIARFYDFLEIQLLGNNEFMVRYGYVASEEQLRDFNRTIVRLGEELNIPVCATGDVHFLKPENEEYRRILMTGQGFDDADRQPPLYFRSTEDMLQEFSYLGEEKAYEVVVENPNKIAGMIEVLRPIPEGRFLPHMDGAEEQLTALVRKRAEELYGAPLPSIVNTRLEQELSAIREHGHATLFWVAHLQVKRSLEHGYRVSTRGTAASSLVTYLAGITEINPLPPHNRCPHCRHTEFFTHGEVGSGYDLSQKDCPVCGQPLERDGQEIPWESLLGSDGNIPPDFDLNFASEYQRYAYQYLAELFGKERVVKAGTISTMGKRTAFYYAWYYNFKKGLELDYQDETIEQWTNGLEDIVRTTGQYPGAHIIIPERYEAEDFTPLQHPGNNQDSEIITTHFDFHDLQDTVLKLNALGHMVPDIYRYLEKYTGIPVTDADLSDPEVYRLFTSPEPLGVTAEQIGFSTGTLSLPEMGNYTAEKILIACQPKNFTELVKASGLTHGATAWKNNAQKLLSESTCSLRDVIGNREDIYLSLIRWGLNAEKAYQIMERVCSHTPLGEGQISILQKLGVPDWYIESCQKIQYLFPKAHAAEYVLMAVRLGWFKLYHPVEYYAAWFTGRGEFLDEAAVKYGPEENVAYANRMQKKKEWRKEDNYHLDNLHIAFEAGHRGVRFLPVDLYRSSPYAFVPEDGAIRLPLTSVRGVRRKTAEAIVRAREKDILSVDDLRSQGVRKKAVSALRRAGVLDGLPDHAQLEFEE